jgi:hypothetical protein
MSANAQVVIKKLQDKFPNPVRWDHRQWHVLSTGTVRGHDIYCHLLELPETQGGSLGFRAAQICDYLPLNEVFQSPDIALIQRIIDYRIPSNLPEIATEICINWLILENDGYSKDDVLKAINTGIELGILYHCFGDMWVGQTLHVA